MFPVFPVFPGPKHLSRSRLAVPCSVCFDSLGFNASEGQHLTLLYTRMLTPMGVQGMKYALRLLSYLKPQIPLQVLGMLCYALYFAAELGFPMVELKIIDQVLVSGNYRELVTVAVQLFVLALVYLFAGVAHHLVFTYTSEKASLAIRNDLLKKSVRIPLEVSRRLGNGKIVALFTSDLPAAQQAFRSLGGETVVRFAYALAIVGVLTWIAPSMGFVALPLALTYGLIPSVLSPRLRKLGALVQNDLARITEVVHETLSGLRDIKALSAQSTMVERARPTFAHLVSSTSKRATMESAAAVSMVIYWLATALIYIVGGRRYFAGQLTLGSLIAAVHYFGRLAWISGLLVQVHTKVQASLAAAERIWRFMDENEEPASSGSQVSSADLSSKGLSVVYSDGTKALENVNLEVPAGQIVGFVGPNGSGKSSFANVVAGFVAPRSGQVLLGETDIRSLGPVTLRERVLFLGPEPFVMRGSVDENIRLGPPSLAALSRKDVERAAELSGASSFITQLPQGYDTVLGEQGHALSSGQRQMIALTRAFLRKPLLLILDEATNSLHPETERCFLENLRAHHLGSTVILVTHRASSLELVDEVVRFEDGKVAVQ